MHGQFNTALNRALDVIGDHWSWLILKEAFLGTTRFQDFQEKLDIPRQTLMTRLGQMTDAALFYKNPVYNRRLLFEYRLTPKGLDLYPVILSIWRFHRRFDLDPASLPEELVHRDCGQPFLPELVCSTCHTIPSPADINTEVRGSVPDEDDRPPVRKTRIANQLASMGDSYLSTVVLGDAWNVLLLDAASRGVHRFHDLQLLLGISSNVLAARLKLMVKLGLLTQIADKQDGRVKNYTLSDKGIETYPLILTLTDWSDRWLAGHNGPVAVRLHATCQTYADFRLQCSACGEPVHVGNVIPARLR